MIGVFIIGLIPILYLSGYVHATGDDYGYGYRAREAWLSSRSVWETLKAAGNTVAAYWNGWQGTWFTIFLMALQPEVFWNNGYWIVPWIMLGITILTTSVLTHYILLEKMHLGRSTWICADILVLTAMIQSEISLLTIESSILPDILLVKRRILFSEKSYCFFCIMHQKGHPLLYNYVTNKNIRKKVSLMKN